MSDRRVVNPPPNQDGSLPDTEYVRISTAEFQSLIRDRAQLNKMLRDAAVDKSSSDILLPHSPTVADVRDVQKSSINENVGSEEPPTPPAGRVQSDSHNAKFAPAPDTRPAPKAIEPDLVLAPNLFNRTNQLTLVNPLDPTTAARINEQKLESIAALRAVEAIPVPPVQARLVTAGGDIQDDPARTFASKVPYAAIMEATIAIIEAENEELLPKDRVRIPRMMTPLAAKIVFTAAEMGVSRRGACALAMINNGMYNMWLAGYRQGREPFVSWFSLFELAEARTEMELVSAFRKHTHVGWQAAEAFMKRRFGDTWGDRQQVQYTTDDIAGMSMDQLEQLLGTKSTQTLDRAITAKDDENDDDDFADDEIDAPEFTEDDDDDDDAV